MSHAVIEGTERARATLPVQRRITLDVLERFGPQPVEAIPRAWPLTRRDVADVVRGLERDGAVERLSDPRVPGRPLARVTPAGRRLLRELDDTAMAEQVSFAEAFAHPVAVPA